MSDILSNIFNKTGKNTSMIGRKDLGEDGLKSSGSTAIEIWEARIKTYNTNISGDTLIWGSQSFGIWNKSKWGSNTSASFVLGHNGAAVLGTSALGSKESFPILQTVTNAHNYFPEQFSNDRFIGSLSTGTLYDGYYELESGQQIYTEYICRENKEYSGINVSLYATYSDGTSAKNDIEILANIGNNYFPVTVDLLSELISNSSDGIKLVLQNKGNQTINLQEFYANYIPATSSSTYSDDTMYLYNLSFTDVTQLEVPHNFESYNTIIQVYDSLNYLLWCSINSVNTSKYNIEFGETTTGTVIVQNISFLKNKIFYINSGTTNIKHELNDDFPIVQVYDSQDNVIFVDEIQIIDANNISVISSDNCKVVIHSANSSQRYSQSFSGNTSYTITHNLDNLYPIIKVYDNNKKEIIPDVTHIVNNNEIEIIFNETTSGTVVLHVGER